MRNMKINIRVYFQPAFLICVAVLVSAELIRPIVGAVIPEKEPLPLKKSLDLLDEQQLRPFKVMAKCPIENEEVVKELGTEDYIQWVLQDPNASPASPVEKVLLFITYYELPDRVPHVPEQCWAGGGYQKLASDSVTFQMRQPDLPQIVPGRYLVFGSTKANIWQESAKFPVVYLFKVNGDYADSRDEARMALNKNLFGKYSYFSKIELVFNQTGVIPTRQEVVEASERLLGVVLPVLEKEHWPDWQKE